MATITINIEGIARALDELRKAALETEATILKITTPDDDWIDITAALVDDEPKRIEAGDDPA